MKFQTLTVAVLLALSACPESVHSQCNTDSNTCIVPEFKSGIQAERDDCHCCKGSGRLTLLYINNDALYGRFCPLCPAGSYSATDYTKGNAYIYEEAVSSSTPGTILYSSGQVLNGPLCTLCAAGQEATNTGSTSCTNCRAGGYSTSPGTASCTKCQAGKYGLTTGATSETNCQFCPAGKFQALTGRSVCSDCLAGSTSNTGAVECTTIATPAPTTTTTTPSPTTTTTHRPRQADRRPRRVTTDQCPRPPTELID